MHENTYFDRIKARILSKSDKFSGSSSSSTIIKPQTPTPVPNVIPGVFSSPSLRMHPSLFWLQAGYLDEAREEAKEEDDSNENNTTDRSNSINSYQQAINDAPSGQNKNQEIQAETHPVYRASDEDTNLLNRQRELSNRSRRSDSHRPISSQSRQDKLSPSAVSNQKVFSYSNNKPPNEEANAEMTGNDKDKGEDKGKSNRRDENNNNNKYRLVSDKGRFYAKNFHDSNSLDAPVESTGKINLQKKVEANSGKLKPHLLSTYKRKYNKNIADNRTSFTPSKGFVTAYGDIPSLSPSSLSSSRFESQGPIQTRQIRNYHEKTGSNEPVVNINIEHIEVRAIATGDRISSSKDRRPNSPLPPYMSLKDYLEQYT